MYGLIYLQFMSRLKSIINNLKRNKCDLDFIEVMACPGGCINGISHTLQILCS